MMKCLFVSRVLLLNLLLEERQLQKASRRQLKYAQGEDATEKLARLVPIPPLHYARHHGGLTRDPPPPLRSVNTAGAALPALAFYPVKPQNSSQQSRLLQQRLTAARQDFSFPF